MMKTNLRFIVLGVICSVWAPIGVSYASIVNGNFDDGLDGWSVEGDVLTETGSAVLGDDGSIYSLLFQGANTSNGMYTLELDFANLLSDGEPSTESFAFLDTFFMSLYFIDDLSLFDLELGVYDHSIALLDMDATGVFSSGGTITGSTLGPDWAHFSMTFENNYNYVIPTFELLDLNFVDNDSQVFLDNIILSPVPEPSTLVLLASGLLMGALRRRRRG